MENLLFNIDDFNVKLEKKYCKDCIFIFKDSDRKYYFCRAFYSNKSLCGRKKITPSTKSCKFFKQYILK